MKQHRYIIPVLGMLIASTVPSEASAFSLTDMFRSHESDRKYEAVVTKISDGDTVWVQPSYSTDRQDRVKIRLYGIDAPESHQSYGKQSTEALKKIAPLRSRIRVNTISKDRYGRSVAVLESLDGKDLNARMLELGHAWYFEKYCTISACRTYRNLADRARQARLGLWHDRDPLPPWEWRKQNRH